MKKLITVLAIALAAVGTLADTETVDGIEWNYTISDGRVTLGGGSPSSRAVPTSTTGAIVIPSTLGGYPVTDIGYRAFFSCRNIESVTIPDGVTSIGDSAFYFCEGLTSMTLPNSVTNIGNSAFNRCYGLTNVTISANVMSIGYSAFSGCNGLTSVTLPNGLTNIGESAFANCSSLTNVTIPNSVTSIAQSSFSGCNSALFDTGKIRGVKLVDGWVVGIERYLLPNDLNLSGVRGIAEGVFFDCDGLVNVTIGSGVTSIGEVAFCNCTNMMSVTLSNGLTSIGDSAFIYCSKLTSVTIPGSVTNIGDNAFCACDGLTNVTIGSGVTRIGNGAFIGCCELTSVNFQGNAPSVDASAFWGVASNCVVWVQPESTGWGVEIPGTWKDMHIEYLPPEFEIVEGVLVSVTWNGAMEVVIPDSVTKIGDWAFHNCISLTNVTIPASVTSIGSGAFEGCGLTSVSLPGSVTNIGDRAFCDCQNLGTVVFNGNAPRVNANAFLHVNSGCVVHVRQSSTGWDVAIPGTWNGLHIEYQLPEFTIENRVLTAVELNGAMDIAIPDGVTSIGSRVFQNCSDLTSVIIPNGLRSINSYAFYNCSGLTSVTIPDSVTSIGSYAFRNCSSLKQVHIFDVAAWCGIGFGDQLYANPLRYANLYLNGELVTALSIPDGVKRINNYAFRNCSSIASVSIPDSVKNIGAKAFCFCTGLTEVVIPNSVTNIGSYAFGGCSGLIGVIISDGVTSIEDEVFYNCSRLASVTIPNGVTSIEYQAFCGCSGLTDVIFMGDAPTVGSSVFSGVNSGCIASVSPQSKGWGVGVGEKWNGLTLQYWQEVLTAVANDAEVSDIVATFADKGLAAQVSSVAEYNAFKAWVNGNNLYQPDVVANTNAAVAYLLGAERLFEKQPVIEIGDVSVGEKATQETGGTEGTEKAISVTVIVKDGEEAVKCATEKVKEMFEATSGLGDWDGTAKLEPAVTVEGRDGATMRFKVMPGDGTAARAFLRVKVK